jgi:opacity protein-like surface antigen
MKRNLLFIVALSVCTLSFGQGELDAYRYASKDISGTARGQAMGGAFGALGGDVTGVAINPAGIGVYRSSEILANLSINTLLTGGKSNQTGHTSVGLDNLSFVGYYPIMSGNVLSLNFGFNYNRIKNFDNRYSASRPAMNSSLTDFMLDLTDGISHSAWNVNDWYTSNAGLPWLSALAWGGWLINEKPGTNDAYESVLRVGEQVSPKLNVIEKGRIEAYDFTIGSNISDQFYWGITAAIVDLSYFMESSYDENFLGSEGSVNDGFSLSNYLETKGAGYQVKAGVIVKPIDELRVGVAYHSPVWYNMTEYFGARLTPRGIFTDAGQPAESESTPNATSKYHFRTPGSWTFSLATILDSRAIVSLDYEIKNYADMNLQDSRRRDMSHENNSIRKHYKNTSTVRAGLEYRFTPQISGRLGYAWAQNPYNMDIKDTGREVETSGTIPHFSLSDCVSFFTGGIGYRFTPQFYVDLAFVLREQKDDLYFFPPGYLSVANPYDSFQGTSTNRTLKTLVTLGYRF